MQFAPVARNDSGRFLAAMLQRVQAQIGHLRGFGMAEDTAHAAVVVETIVFDLDQTAHSAFRKSVVAQEPFEGSGPGVGEGGDIGADNCPAI